MFLKYLNLIPETNIIISHKYKAIIKVNLMPYALSVGCT